MADLDRALVAPPLSSSLVLKDSSPAESAAESVHAFPPQPAIGQPESESLIGESPSSFEPLDLVMLQFVRCLVGHGATLDDASIIVSAELTRLRTKRLAPQLVS